MKKIKLKRWKQGNRVYIRIDLSTDPELDLVLSSIDTLSWDKVSGCYSGVYTKGNLHRLFEYLVSEGWYVDYSDFTESKRTDLPPPQLPKEDPLKEKDHRTDMEDFMLWMHQMRYSKNTIKTYVGLLHVFFDFFKEKAPTEINLRDIERFNQEYILGNGYSRVFQNQLISALKLYYMRYHNQELDIMHLERPRKARKLPEVLSKEEVIDLLTAVRNLKHRFLLSLVYSCGLRIGEALNLRLTDLDTTRKFMHVRHAKGAKDRFIPLSDRTLEKLRDYLRTYRPKDYIFEGQDGGPYTQSSARQAPAEGR